MLHFRNLVPYEDAFCAERPTFPPAPVVWRGSVPAVFTGEQDPP